jgi:probable FeS assembly SUF system protein SufT
MVNQDITLEADCRATRIPLGEEVQLAVGTVVTVTQTLGGSVTVRGQGELYRVAPDQVAALGETVVAALQSADEAPLPAGDFSEEQVWDALRQCFDPEIPVNIVDLGLVYDLTAREAEEGRHEVTVKMTLTAQGCGMGPHIAADAQQKIERLPAVSQAHVDIVWDPQWTPHMISDEGRKVLGLT